MTNFRRRKARTGSVMVEFALILPLLVSLFLGVVIFGYDFHVYQRLEESARAGARFASMQRYDGRLDNNNKPGTDPVIPECTAPPCRTEIKSGHFAERIKKIVAYGCDPDVEAASDCTDTPITESVTPANVLVYLTTEGLDPETGQIKRTVTVSLNDVSIWTPTGKVSLGEKPTTTFTHVGIFIPR